MAVSRPSQPGGRAGLYGADAPYWNIALGIGLLAAAGVLVVVLARRVASAQRRAELDTEP